MLVHNDIIRGKVTMNQDMRGIIKHSHSVSMYEAPLLAAFCTSQGRWNDLPKYMHSTYTYNGQEFDPQTFVTLVQREVNRLAGFPINVDVILCLTCRLCSRGRPTETMFGHKPPGQDVYSVEHHFA